ncbi:hypothetical protein BCT30_07250 [Enterovibrio norvegicus]|uniref:hypothetical protein n=1 Tax=Enterovibrio norvegicus TaxID=188144 RepID=UPI00030B4F7C|nr:hypothetical protein [Enterovibrio norvegicus]MCC4797140.1 hypothetical protein [Enterovibrio norvegicus]OEE50241.1 hypothetical protein A1OS_06590 [Enterovibrio norvegicus]PMH64006.1 hypothetical protein BCU62_17435 [Enterovibrio norvegicus]PMI35277.1 hypothetical protein BCU46_18500 [Enterovibrio norvegicus]PMN56248.1 hypothetical protein BCT30_07250 [Enterovibrio norvegicus]
MYKASPRQGLLPELDSERPLQTQFVDPVATAVRQLKGTLGDTLHSAYLSGDIAHRTAPDKATMNVTLVTQRSLNVNEYSMLNTVRFRIEQGSEAISRVAIDVVPINDVRDLGNIFKWGFFLKHCTQCIQGDNLAQSFGHFEVSWEVCKAMNDDLSARLRELRNKVAIATKWGTQLDAAEEAASRLIKASFGLVAYKANRWEEELDACSRVFLEFYPDKTLEMERLFYLIQRKPVKKRAVVALLDAHWKWVVDEYEKTDRKIG